MYLNSGLGADRGALYYSNEDGNKVSCQYEMLHFHVLRVNVVQWKEQPVNVIAALLLFFFIHSISSATHSY